MDEVTTLVTRYTTDVTLTNLEDPQISKLLQVFQTFVKTFGLYFTMVMIVSGIFGNLLSVIIFWRLRNTDKVIATYLTPIAVYDLTVLCVGFSGWLDEATFTFSNGGFYLPEGYTEAHCRFRLYLLYSCGMMSSWTLTVFCTERCIAIRNPFDAIKIFTFTTRRNTIIGVVICASIIGAFPIPSVILTPTKSLEGGLQCYAAPTTPLKSIMNIIVETGFSTTLPLVSLMILNVILFTSLNKSDNSLDLSRHGMKGKKKEMRILINFHGIYSNQSACDYSVIIS
jgi:hypothetical protein